MLTQPNSAGTGGKAVTKVEFSRRGYETNWPITINGAEHTLDAATNTFLYTEGQEIEWKFKPEEAKVVVQGDTLKIHLVGDAVGGGGGDVGVETD